MPFDALTNADNFRILGSLTVVDDPNGNSGNANIKGTHTVSGSLIAGSALQVAGSALLNGDVKQGATAQFIATMPLGSATNQVQLLGTSSAGISQTVTMTGSGRIVPISFTNTSTVSIGLIPTLSTSVSDGTEVTILNISPSGTNLAIPSSLMGSISQAKVVTVSGMSGQRFVYSALLQTWLISD